MDAREVESQLLTRCAQAARDYRASAVNAVEANVFRLAGMVVRSEFPGAWRNLTATSQRYFDSHPLHADRAWGSRSQGLGREFAALA